MIRALVTDLNGSFAAMEQHHDPGLRGRPVAVCPVLAETGCVVASSREAKRHGVKCGVLVAEARRMCPDLHLMQATPGLYASYQQRMKEVLEDVLPVYSDPNIDEFRFRLIGDECDPDRARELAMEMKRALREAFSPCITMSAGIAPNMFLAKAATNLQKDDGLVLLTDDDVPHALNRFDRLDQLVGISWRMKVRLNAHGIFTVADLTVAPKEKLREVWGGVVGERWWYQMRGHEIEEPVTRTSSMGHSHVLPLERRNREGVKAIALRLLGKATARLRAGGYWTCALSVSVSGRQSWERHQRIPETQDDRDLVPLVAEWLESAEYAWPLKVSVTFYDICRQESFTPSLFAQDEEWGRPEPAQPPHEPSLFGGSLDHANNEYGKHKVFLAAIEGVRHNATEKIAFQKKTLFREGRDDTLPTWHGGVEFAPAEALLHAVERGEALTDLAEARRTAPPRDRTVDVFIWEPIEIRSFAMIADHVRDSLANDERRLHRGELRRLVVRLLREIGYCPAEIEMATELVFRAVDAGSVSDDPPADLFSDDFGSDDSFADEAVLTTNEWSRNARSRSEMKIETPPDRG